MNILVLNSGSSSLKFQLFEISESEESISELKLAGGVIERIGLPGTKLKWSLSTGKSEEEAVSLDNPSAAVEHVIGLLRNQDGPMASKQIDAIGHRIVHGGIHFVEPTLISADTLRQLDALTELAPLHNPSGLAGIAAGLKLLPDKPAVAVFDTAFHHRMPAEARLYALPQEFAGKAELRRYGFHGISYRYVSQKLFECLGDMERARRLVICHLGNGASVCAIRDGNSIDTSMGFTPLEGLIMGTRSGDVDPGLVLYLMHTAGKSPVEMEDLLNKKSGLLSLSGRSADLRDIEKSANEGDEQSMLALSCFAYRVRKYIGAYAAALGGLDALVFTGGIGEHSATMRSRILTDLDFIGWRLDQAANQATTGTVPARISQFPVDAATPSIWVIPTDEELQIARETYTLLKT